MPDAFVLRRNDSFPKFLLNACGAVSTDTMHRIKFHPGYDKEKVLLSYYNSISLAFTEICGRSYGGGVLEILPRELGNVLLPDLSGFSSKRTKKLLQLIDDEIRKNGNGNFDKVLDIVDREVLVNYIGITEETCEKFREIWKTLMDRRRGRSQ